MSAAQFSNGLGSVRIADRQHINPILQGILYNTDRKAQVAVLKEESRRSSVSSSASSVSSSAPLYSSSRKSSVVSPDTVAHAAYSKDKKRSKSSLFGMASFGKNRGVAGVSNVL
ncbi:hypothetical protein ISF_05501 [Cordyceps fumosorosea ARSEF 2679]|uniref:Uncharacterized protein n=1 Tax=Cordyceps fumosorosea (strain ARSEF 2679) TaxID=1081104 RepID=A0A167UBM5_CORFA|nr:hypothetical protein ISF_05501 [Cordyceps fumosorosea ARSEF 2679]OAA61422.1 hypothetical protein ISF_05501 [Cordyceps fumosorosea ARSEF 2679]